MTARTFRRTESVLRRAVGAEALLYDPRRDVLHVLNGTAAAVWDELARPRTLADLEGALRERFAVGRGAAVAADLERLLADLVDRGLAVSAEP